MMKNKEIYAQVVDGINQLLGQLDLKTPDAQIFAASCLLGIGSKMLHQAGVHQQLVHQVIGACWEGVPTVPRQPEPELLN
jgi:hypothetical protein